MDEATQAFIRREVQKQLSERKEGFAAGEYDWALHPANIFPGRNWQCHSVVGMGSNAYILWIHPRTPEHTPIIPVTEGLTRK